MAGLTKSDAVGTLVRHTTGVADFAIHVGHQNRTYMEYLPYPDDNFHEIVDECIQRAQTFTIEHIHRRSGQAFVPNVRVHIRSITAERTHAGFTESLNPYLYCIKIEHGAFQWSIYKRYRDFHDLHKALMHFSIVQRRRSTSDLELYLILADYLNKVLRHPKFRAHQATRKFFDVSCLSFINGLSFSRKEGYLLNRSKDDYHGRQWFIIKDSYVVYMQPDTHEIRFPMLVDRNFQILSGLRNAGAHHGIKIINLQRTLVVKCETARDCEEWLQHLKNLTEQANGFFGSKVNQFNSYAPIRENQLAHWFINGKSYMEAVAKALLTAKDEVFITDWWLSPEIMMIRPMDDETYRLDNILGRIADAGIRVYVMIYKEIKRIVSLNSLYTEKKLISKSKKGFIKVIRHPDHFKKNGVYLWSHHEKMVIIDQKIAFVGGIDLCYGRWDDEYMRLVDLGDENDRTLKPSCQINEENVAIGNTKIVEAAKTITTQMTEQPSTILINHSNRMITSLEALYGTNEDIRPSDLTTHAHGTERRMKSIAGQYESVTSDESVCKHDKQVIRRHGRREQCAARWRQIIQNLKKNNEASDDEETLEEQQSIITSTSEVDRKHRYFIGKDYSNSYQKDFEELENHSKDYIDRKSVPRMPWHDEALVVFGQAARDVARHFIQRWNTHKYEKKPKDDSYPFLLPKAYDDEQDLTIENWRNFLESRPFHVNAQCVRSVGPWSIRTRTTESSIQNAYIQMIDAAKYFIYIENQFFITIANNRVVQNQLADVLFRRIQRAHTLHEKFRVYVVLPLFPGFDSVDALKAVLFYIMCSITKGDKSLFSRLEKAGISPRDYINFFGMRNHDVLMGRLVTEIIYVHSKLMIIDDRMAICGSANINDRSLLGERDSEFCIVINDLEEEESRFNGQPVRVGKFCSSWRRRIFKMLLGIQFENPNNVDVTDPVSDEFYSYFRDVAKQNTLIYEKVFATIPTDHIRRFAQIPAYNKMATMKDTDPIRAQQELISIQGFVVEYPLYFLDEEDYLPNKISLLGFAPLVTWT
ncbi:unnamed protein product [Rotaria sp. Silwood2]|nr:unnamed protein product [Rotaria sp. Silwood2]